jgi:hypothetical protein
MGVYDYDMMKTLRRIEYQLEILIDILESDVHRSERLKREREEQAEHQQNHASDGV